MSEIQCLKCEQPAEKMTEPLFLGKLGRRSQEQRVPKLLGSNGNKPGGLKTMVINEYHLKPW